MNKTSLERNEMNTRLTTAEEQAVGQPPIRVLLAGADSRARAGLKAFLASLQTNGLQVIGEAVSGREIHELLLKCPADLVLLDGPLPDISPLALIQQLKAAQPGIDIAILSLYAAGRREALAGGATAFVVKSGPQVAQWAAIIAAIEAKKHLGGPVQKD